MFIPSRSFKFQGVYHNPVTPPTPPTEYVPFTVKVLNAGTSVSILKYNTPPPATLYYSVDDGDWTEYIFGDNILVSDHIAFSGTTETFSQNDGNTYRLNVSDDYIVSGHLDSLINEVSTIPNYAFWCFFNLSTKLRDATNLIIPSGAFGNHVFERLFYKCENLTAGPALPAVELSGLSYRNMFAECHSMVKVGAIGAKVIRWASMLYMFYNCTSLTALPEFSPTFIEYSGCKQMCHYCSSIRELNLPWSQLSSVNTQSCLSAFSRCTSLVSVSGSIGTSDMTFNNGNNNFQGCFQGCTSLVDASNLTFNALNINGSTTFGRCFRDDSSLTGAPNLPATGMNYQCYNTMFRLCSSLKDAPYLPAQIPAEQCYNHMFNGCSSLTGVNVALTSWGTNFQYGSTASWLLNVAANGTFTKPDVLSKEYDSSRIPNGWTVIDIDTRVPLTFESTGNTTVKIFQDGTPDNQIDVLYKLNNGSWTSYTLDTVINLSDGDTLAFKNNTNYWSGSNWGDFYRFGTSGDGTLRVYGELASLVNYSYVLNTYHTFNSLFSNCSQLTDAYDLILFNDINGNTPESVYSDFFNSCSNLVRGPRELPSGNIGYNCYQQMFAYCSSLTAGPIVRGTPNYGDWMACWYGMFNGCTSLNTITVDFTSWGEGNFDNWVQDVAANGTFYKPADLAETYGNNNIPNGWTVIDL